MHQSLMQHPREYAILLSNIQDSMQQIAARSQENATHCCIIQESMQHIAARSQEFYNTLFQHPREYAT
jgi:hypothetical protein